MKNLARILAGLLLLILAIICWLFWVPGQALAPYGRATCDGNAVADIGVYRSKQGDIFVYCPRLFGQPAVVSPKSRDLGRCNSPAFSRMFGRLLSKEADPTVQCTSMWKGSGSGDVLPPHIVTANHAEFPWGSCGILKVDY